MTDLAQIGVKSQFAEAISEYFYKNKLKVIVETGLYHGTGSTSLIAALVRGVPLDADFYSIECNEKSIKIATENLSHDGLIDYVDIQSGLSIPKHLIPSIQDVVEDIRVAKRLDMYVDHEVESCDFYTQETSIYERDDVLGQLFKYLDYKIDFILLDSAGHIGWIEFKYVLSLLKNPCAIALDDTQHLKHYRSLEFIKNDSKFKLIHESNEKFGSAMAIYTP